MTTTDERMSKLQEFNGKKIGDIVVPLIGPKKGVLMRVVAIETEGALDGWFTCQFGSLEFLYAGEEIQVHKEMNQ